MKPLRIMVVAALAVVLAFGIAGCGNKDVAARVNGDPISLTEFQNQVNQVKERLPDYFKGQDAQQRELEFKQRILDELINQKLIMQAAEERGIKVTDADVQAQIDGIKKRFPNAAAFEAALKNAGFDTSTLEEVTRMSLVNQRLTEQLAKDVPKPTEAEIKAYYDSHKAEFTQTAAKRASQIVVKDQAQAAKILAQLKAGADFAKMAKSSSIDTISAANGGDLGWPATSYVKDVQEAVAKLKVGQLSGVFKSQLGYAIVKVTEARAAKQQTIAEARDTIIQKIANQKKADLYQKLLKELRAKAKIEIYVEDLATKVNTGSSAATGTK